MLHEINQSPPLPQPRQLKICFEILIENRSSPPHLGHGPQRAACRRLNISPGDLVLYRHAAGTINQAELRRSAIPTGADAMVGSPRCARFHRNQAWLSNGVRWSPRSSGCAWSAPASRRTDHAGKEASPGLGVIEIGAEQKRAETIQRYHSQRTLDEFDGECIGRVCHDAGERTRRRVRKSISDRSPAH